MNQKIIGITLIIIGVLVILSTWQNRNVEDFHIEQYVMKQNTCFLDDGTCLHKDRNDTFHIILFSLGFSLIIFGVYIGFLDKTQKLMEDHQLKVSEALSNAKNKKKKKMNLKHFYLVSMREKQRY